MKIGKVKLFLCKNKNEFIRLNIKSVAIKRRRVFPVSLVFVNNIGTWRKKKRMLAKKEELIIFPDSSYNLFKIKPRESISSDIAVAKARITIK